MPEREFDDFNELLTGGAAQHEGVGVIYRIPKAIAVVENSEIHDRRVLQTKPDDQVWVHPDEARCALKRENYKVESWEKGDRFGMRFTI